MFLRAVSFVPSSLQLRQLLPPRQAWRWSQHHLQWLRVKTTILHRLQLCYLRGILHERHHLFLATVVPVAVLAHLQHFAPAQPVAFPRRFVFVSDNLPNVLKTSISP